MPAPQPVGKKPAPPPAPAKLPKYIAHALIPPLEPGGDWVAVEMLMQGDVVLSRKVLDYDIKATAPRSSIIRRQEVLFHTDELRAVAKS